jgi:hypothetical protein
MQEALESVSGSASGIGSRERIMDVAFTLFVLILATAVFGAIFNRATVLSYSIGYNLYGSERVLLGDIPYRDFDSLYPPGTIYVNVALFKSLGVSLYSAMVGVLAFKILAVLVLYLSASKLMPRSWAVAAILMSLLWLRPNGAFKSVPMQYGALLLALALYLLLKYLSEPGIIYLALVGATLGLLTLFKHNIGGYAFVGVVCFMLVTEGLSRGLARGAVVAGGVAAVIAPVLVYMQVNHALVPMARTLLLGPGEFLAGRLAMPRSPLVPAAITVVVIVLGYLGYRLRGKRVAATVTWCVLIGLLSALIVAGDEPVVNKLVFYVPIFLLITGLAGILLNRSFAQKERRALALTGIVAASAFLELFPRLAREQSIAAMPFVIVFAMYLQYLCRPTIRRITGGGPASRLALLALPTLFMLIGLRLFVTTYFDEHLHFISNTQLSSARGVGVFFPKSVAKTTDDIVDYIQQQVPVDEYIFAQSNAGSPYLFLAGRRNPSSAQFWGGIGVTESERAATLDEIKHRRVRLVITNDEARGSEPYEPLREYIEDNFQTSVRFEKILILSR